VHSLCTIQIAFSLRTRPELLQSRGQQHYTNGPPLTASQNPFNFITFTARRETRRASSQVTHLIVYKILQAADLRRNQKRPSKSFRQLTVHSRKATYFIRNLGISCQESKYFLSENWVKINSIFRILSSSPADRHPCWVI